MSETTEDLIKELRSYSEQRRGYLANLAMRAADMIEALDNNTISVDGKLFDVSQAKVKTYSEYDGEYCIGGFYEVKE